jgi:hypothetical protein
MSTSLALSRRLLDVSEEVKSKRGEAQRRWARFEQARERAAEEDNPEAFRALEAAHAEYQAVCGELEALDDKRDGFWSVVSGMEPGRRPERFADEAEPGAWLSRVLQRHALTTAEIGSVEDVGRVFFDRFREASALMASGPTVVDIDTTSIKIPTLTDRLAPAPIVPELDPIPEVTTPLDLQEVKPPKLAQLTTLSTEAYTDARPVVLAANERELIGSIGSGFDLGAFHGAAGSAQVGLENTPGIAIIDAAAR